MYDVFAPFWSARHPASLRGRLLFRAKGGGYLFRKLLCSIRSAKTKTRQKTKMANCPPSRSLLQSISVATAQSGTFPDTRVSPYFFICVDGVENVACPKLHDAVYLRDREVAWESFSSMGSEGIVLEAMEFESKGQDWMLSREKTKRQGTCTSWRLQRRRPTE